MRDAAEVLDVCPWASSLVALIHIRSAKDVSYAKTITGKRELLRQAKSSHRVLVAWPGAWSQDIFELQQTNRPAVAEKLGAR